MHVRGRENFAMSNRFNTFDFELYRQISTIIFVMCVCSTFFFRCVCYIIHSKSILTVYRDGSVYAFYIAICVFLHEFFYRDELYSWWFLERLSICFIILFVLCIWSSTFCKCFTWQKPVIIDLPWKGCKTWDKGNAARNIFYKKILSDFRQ